MNDLRFDFATAGRVLFGAGELHNLGWLAGEFGRRALLVTGGSSGFSSTAVDLLLQAGVESAVYTVNGEPKVEDAEQAAQMAVENGAEVVIGLGGGSALDAAKAAAALATNPGSAFDYLEVVGKGQPLRENPLPVIAIPTTAGTGTEVTRNAVLAVPEQRVKVSLRHALMLPRLALVDPELTYTLPPDVTAYTGLDALTQVIEPFVSNRANPLTDALCREAIPLVARSLRRACQFGQDPQARADMSLAALFGGMALANARLGAVHGFAAPIGGMFPAPHGAVCARLLPLVMNANLHALQQRQPDHPALDRYTEIGRLLTGNDQARPEDGVKWVQALVDELHIAPLSKYGMTEKELPAVTAAAARASSMQGNPVVLKDEELMDVLRQAL
jgi:alcohol dehydrogenase class IV